MRRNIKLTIAYDGTNYHGWQKQSYLTTVGGTIEAGLKKMLNEDIKITCASRTDAGTHAYAQVINFFSNTTIPLESFPKALNTYLPKDIVAYQACFMPQDFNARFSAKYRRYHYLISNTPYPNVFLRNYTYWYLCDLNLESMEQASKFFIGKHNFTYFASRMKGINNPIRDIISLNLSKNTDNIIKIEIIANAFLPTMIRSIVGGLIEVGRGNFSLQDIQDILFGKRSRACPIVPAYGLYLIEVKY